MALSRSMKELMHQAAAARRAGGNPTARPGPEAQSRTFKRHRAAQPVAGTRASLGRPVPGVDLSGMAESVRGKGTRYDPADDPARARGKPQPGAGTFGFVSRRGGGTPALQRGTRGGYAGPMSPALQRSIANMREQNIRQRTAPRAAPAGALAAQRGEAMRQRMGARMGPPARRGGMARALGSGGSRRRLLR